MQDRLAKVDEIVERYGSSSEAIIQILLDVQKEFRWLPKETLAHLAYRLSIPLNHIYNLATFYSHFSLEPRGRHSLSVCVGTACHVRGAERLLERVSDSVSCRAGETTKDEKFSLTTVNCLGACALGPVMVADGEYMSNPTPEEIRKKVESCE